MGSYAPVESAAQITTERIFLSTDYILGIGNGFNFCFFVGSLALLWEGRAPPPKALGRGGHHHSTREPPALNRPHQRNAFVLGVLITALFLVSSVSSTIPSRILQDIYIDHRNYPGGPWAYFNSDLVQKSQILTAHRVLFLSAGFMAEVIICWRTWAVWRILSDPKQPKIWAVVVPAFPLGLLLASLALGLVEVAQSTSLVADTIAGTASPSPLLLSYILSLLANVLSTSLIGVRILLYRRHQLSERSRQDNTRERSATVRRQISPYALVVDSGALTSVVSLALGVAFAANRTTGSLFLSVTFTAQVKLSAHAIVHRVADESAQRYRRRTAHVEANQFSTIQFLKSSPATRVTSRDAETADSIVCPIATINPGDRVDGC